MKLKPINALLLWYHGNKYFQFLTNSASKLQRLQITSLRLAFSVYYGEHVTPYYDEYETLKVNARYCLRFAILFYDVLETKTPVYF